MRGLPKLKFQKDKLCDTCQKDKQTKIAHTMKTNVSTSTALEYLHMNLFDDNRYTSLTWLFFLKHKNKTLKNLDCFM